MLVKAPNPIPEFDGPSLFLAGSIEQGAAVDWQTRAAEEFSDILVMNPRREEWDASWEQRRSNPQFREQVEWELDALERASLILMHFEPDTKSPITLLELGLHADDGKLIVSCPDGYWRKGNVEVVCDKYAIPLYNVLDNALLAVRDELVVL